MPSVCFADYRMGGKDGISKYANLSHDDASARFNDDKHHYHGPSGPFFTQVKEKLGDKCAPAHVGDNPRHGRAPLGCA